MKRGLKLLVALLVLAGCLVFAGALARPEFSGQFVRVVFAILRRVDEMYIVRDRASTAASPDNHDLFTEVFRSHHLIA